MIHPSALRKFRRSARALPVAVGDGDLLQREFRFCCGRNFGDDAWGVTGVLAELGTDVGHFTVGRDILRDRSLVKLKIVFALL